MKKSVIHLENQLSSQEQENDSVSDIFVSQIIEKFIKFLDEIKSAPLKVRRHQTRIGI